MKLTLTSGDTTTHLSHGMRESRPAEGLLPPADTVGGGAVRDRSTTIDRSAFDGLLMHNRYLVLGTADAEGRPWVTPVFFASLDPDRVCWVSSPDSRHSRNIAARAELAITVFDSTVGVGQAEAAYADAEGAPLTAGETSSALHALNSLLPDAHGLSRDDLTPTGPLAFYQATLRRRYVLVRGGSSELGDATDTTLEVTPA